VAGYLRVVVRPMAVYRWKAVGYPMAGVRLMEAFRRSAACSTADAAADALPVDAAAADALPVDAAAAVATWEAGWPSKSCCSTRGGSDSGRPSNC